MGSFFLVEVDIPHNLFGDVHPEAISKECLADLGPRDFVEAVGRALLELLSLLDLLQLRPVHVEELGDGRRLLRGFVIAPPQEAGESNS